MTELRIVSEPRGYEIVADIPDYPKGHSYHVLKKKLL
jgi:hypothetical protein